VSKLLYIPSLHRPFSQQLKTTKWVCEFVLSSNEKITSSNLTLDFYLYLIDILHNQYKKQKITEYNGLPSELAVNAVYSYFKDKDRENLKKEIPNIIKSRTTNLEKQIYSTYKSASYFVNLAKDKFKLINEKNELTENGKVLLSFKANFFNLSKKEKEFYFVRILEADFHLFITHCLFSKLEKKYSLSDTIKDQFEFFDKFFEIAHFNFTTASLQNYNTVRAFWAKTIDVIDGNRNIRRNFLSIIESNPYFRNLFEDINVKFDVFEKENFKIKRDYLNKKIKFIVSYGDCLKSNLSDLGYINLYDIKEKMRISDDKFQDFLNDFYELEKNTLNIFFSNTVNSIDRRKRFIIRSRPVIKIKLK
jgi:hypothetical protein